eukprot:5191072-Prymnesium_polylepis.1
MTLEPTLRLPTGLDSGGSLACILCSSPPIAGSSFICVLPGMKSTSFTSYRCACPRRRCPSAPSLAATAA